MVAGHGAVLFVVGLVVLVSAFGFSAFRRAECFRPRPETIQARHPERAQIASSGPYRREVHVFQEFERQRESRSFSPIGLLFRIETNGWRVAD